MRIISKEQISELLTRMVEQHAPDEDLAGVIRYSAAYISGRRALDKTCQEYGLYRYLTTCVPSLSEVSSKLATLIAKNDCTLDAEHMLAFGNQLLEFYKDLEAYSVELYFIMSDNPWYEMKQTKEKVAPYDFICENPHSNGTVVACDVDKPLGDRRIGGR
jgi:hypothetical protein